MTTFYITSQKNPEMLFDYGFLDGVTEYRLDLSQWAAVNGAITSVTWTVKSGNATISSEALSSNVASALITMPQAGNNLIQVKATTGTDSVIAYLDLTVKDPQAGTDAYGF